MGNSGSSSSATDHRFAYASRAFTHKELEDLRSLFDSLAAQLQSNGNYVSPPALKCYRMWKVIVVEDFRKWCAFLSSARKFLCSLLMLFDSGSQIPQLLHQDLIDPSLIVLKKEYAWHFGGALPPYERTGRMEAFVS